MDQFTFYDLETTGREVRYDVPIQFAAVRTDGDLRPTHEVEYRGRPPAHVLPSPGALVTTGRTIAQVHEAPLSFYELMARIEAEVSESPASCYCAFNGMRYDEEMLRHSLYQSLRQPYLTQREGNTRADAMRLLQALHVLQPGRIVVPENQNGRPTFKQEALASANGITGHRAHDAVGDVRAMVDLVRLARDRAEVVWQMFPTWTNKWALEEMLSVSPVVLMAEWLGRWGKPWVKSLHPLCPNPQYPTEWALLDLAVHPDLYLHMSAEQLSQTMRSRSGPKAIIRVKTNAMPILLPGNHVLARDAHPVDAATRESRVQLIGASADFAERVGQAMALVRELFKEPVHVEDRLYSDGFFPIEEDRTLVEVFHVAAPRDKKAILDRMADPRARELGGRLIFSEWPETLGHEERRDFQRALGERWSRENSVPWMTVSKALDEISLLRGSCDGDAYAILDGYERYLHTLLGDLAA